MPDPEFRIEQQMQIIAFDKIGAYAPYEIRLDVDIEGYQPLRMDRRDTVLFVCPDQIQIPGMHVISFIFKVIDALAFHDVSEFQFRMMMDPKQIRLLLFCAVKNLEQRLMREFGRKKVFHMQNPPAGSIDVEDRISFL